MDPCTEEKGALKEAGDALSVQEHCPKTLYRLVQESAKSKDRTSSRRLLCLIICSGLDSSSIFASSLIRLFAVCRGSAELHQIFWRLPGKNVYGWTALIVAYISLGQCAKALSLYYGMQRAGVKPDGYTFVAILKACVHIPAWTQGRLIHAHITEMGMEANLHVRNTLVDMYAKAGCMEDFLWIFYGIQNRDIIAWNAVISGLFQCGYVLKALDFFKQLEEEDGVESNIVTWNAVIAGCVHHGLHEAALQFFMRMQQSGLIPDQITWNSLLYGFIQCNHGHETLQLFRQMLMEGVGPDCVTFMCVFKACSSLSSLRHAKIFHSQMIEAGISTTVIVESSLIDMYAKCGNLKAASEIFSHRMFEKDLVSWNTIIAGHLHHAYYRESFHLFEKMLSDDDVMPRQVTFVLMLKACADSGYLYEARILHTCILESSCEVDMFVATALINVYMKCANLRDARIVFNKMPKRGLVTWSALIAGYAWHGYAEEASWLIQEMQQDGLKSTVITWNGIIRGCAYNGLCAEAFKNFQQMLIDYVDPNEATFVSVFSACITLDDVKKGEVAYTFIVEEGWESGCSMGSALINMYANADCLEASLWIFDSLSKQDIQVWSAMIEAFAQNQYIHETMELCQGMQQQGLFLTQMIIASILKACIGAKMLYQSKVVHVQALELGFESERLVGHSLISVYSKCGMLKDAWHVFHRIQNRDEVTWTAMVEACAEHNDYKMALQCFQGMQIEHLDPNEVSFLSLLSVCSRAGLTEDACHYFTAMSNTYSIIPSFTHHTCMIDLFGRTGCLVLADDLLHTMPFEPNYIGHISMLNHCKTYGNYHVGKDYFCRTYCVTHLHGANYDFMLDIHSQAGSPKNFLLCE